MEQFNTRVSTRRTGSEHGVIQVAAMDTGQGNGHGMAIGLLRPLHFVNFDPPLLQPCKDKWNVLPYHSNSSPSWDHYYKNTLTYHKSRSSPEHNSSTPRYFATCFPCTE